MRLAGGRAIGQKASRSSTASEAVFDDFLLRNNSVGVQDGHLEVMKSRFNMFVGLVIFVNALVIAVETDHPGLEVWIYFEHVFTVFFSLELVIRLYWEHLQYFVSAWNWLDFSCIVTSVIDVWLIPLIAKLGLAGSSDGDGLKSLSLFRVLRLFRLIRLLRIFKMFHELYMVVCAFVASLKAIAWMTVILTFGVFFLAILSTQVLGQNPNFKDIPIEDGTVKTFFGSVPKSMYSLFELMLMEGWTGIARPLVHHAPYMILFFIGFFMTFSYGLLNMFVGLIVEKSIESTRQNASRIKKDQYKDMSRLVDNLKAVFLETDENQDGFITKEEFTEALHKNEKVAKALEAAGLPHRMWRELFDILDVGDSEEVDVEGFLKGCLRLKGEARTQDMVANQISITRLQQTQKMLLQELTLTEAGQDDILQRIARLKAELTAKRLASPRKLPPDDGSVPRVETENG